VLTGACVPSVSAACLPLTAKQGRLSNQLLAQTLTLGLNLRINDGLGAVPLEAGKWLTTQEKLFCEKGSPGILMDCNAVPVIDPYSYFWLPEVVLDFMTEKGYSMTVQGLFNLANDALGQARVLPAEVTLAKIAAAVDMINNAFDGCRIFVGNLDEKLTCPAASGEGKSVSILDTGNSGLKVYPNPFSDKVTFEFTSPQDAHAVLEIHNLLGQKINVLMDVNVKQGVVNKAEYEPAGQSPGILIYQLKLDDSVQTGRLIYNR